MLFLHVVSKTYSLVVLEPLDVKRSGVFNEWVGVTSIRSRSWQGSQWLWWVTGGLICWKHMKVSVDVGPWGVVVVGTKDGWMAFLFCVGTDILEQGEVFKVIQRLKNKMCFFVLTEGVLRETKLWESSGMHHHHHHHHHHHREGGVVG